MGTDISSPAKQYSLQSIVPTLPASLVDTSATDSNPQNDFLKLMVAQLQNQDPDKPTDGTELISQLTQMESAFAVQRESFLNNADSQITTSAALLGKKVTIVDPNTGEPSAGAVSTVDFSGTTPTVTVNGQAYPLSAVNQVST